MTRSAMVIERLAAESGHPAAAILAHVGICPYRNNVFRACRSFMFGQWQVSEGDSLGMRDAGPEFYRENWASWSQALLVGIGEQGPCPNCETPCHPARLNEPMREVE